MKNRTSIQFKAAFLTFIFLLNIMVGFACAMGAERAINPEHAHSHDQGNHAHDKAADGHHHSSSKESKDNCCQDEVAKLTKSDKTDLRFFDYSLLSLSCFVLPVTAYPISGLRTFPISTSNGYFVRHCRSPIQDIRIAIQSFQI
ncbi:hypothetical protein SAMN03003324_03835 [Pedobacter antarcticus]|jgi:hypothetical protein|uniref:Uncharacterized protein n=2 Tax=Pedobacter antarcticus TaxID=34086 RepID=A0A1I2ILD5_9SPHI|nr:hypothetical protein [Pedobacter antarcticus]SFF43212.1 hypothetical protein SAMN03003324_03835 [Pedobacter antarcticus]